MVFTMTSSSAIPIVGEILGVMHLKHMGAFVLCSFLALHVKQFYYELMLLMPHLAIYFNFILIRSILMLFIYFLLFRS